MSSIRSPVKTIVIASGTPSGANSGPSYTFSREHTFISQDGSAPVYTDGLPIAFVEYKFDATFYYDVEPTNNTKLLTNGGVAFLCPTTLSKITGSINFGFRDATANDISLNIYKTSITDAYTSFATGATLLSSSRFVYNTPNSAANITVPVNVTTAGLTNNDIVYVAFEMDPPSPGPVLSFTMRYTLSFS